jgi:peptidyl-prolyl cis-trans isomerase C
LVSQQPSWFAGDSPQEVEHDRLNTQHKESAMARAVASHILVSTQVEAQDLKAQIEEGASFADLAKKHSQCPSGRDGGNLGEFGRGDMVPEFDAVVFGDLPVGQCSEPVKTQFGYHLLIVSKRVG